MSILAIANLSDNFETIGFRLLDTLSKQVKDVPIKSIRKALLQGKVKIDNLKIEDGTVVGYNGDISRLPKIVNGILNESSPLIIINKIADIGFTVADFKGDIKKWKSEDVIRYATYNGISNGKVVYKDGKRYISAIEGEYQNISNADLSEEEIKIVNSKLSMLYNVVKSYAYCTIVSKDNLLGVISNNGKLITEYKYTEIDVIDERTAIVSTGYTEKGIISLKTGKEIIECNKFRVSQMGKNGDLFLIIDDYAWICNYTGKRVSNLYDEVDLSIDVGHYYAFINNDDKNRKRITIIDYYGKNMGIYESMYGVFNTSSKVVKLLPSAKCGPNRFGVIDYYGKLITKDTFNYINYWADTECFTIGQLTEKGQKYDIIGMHVLDSYNASNMRFDSVGKFVKGWAITSMDGKLGVIAKSGRIIIDHKYKAIEFIDENSLRLVDEYGEYTYTR